VLHLHGRELVAEGAAGELAEDALELAVRRGAFVGDVLEREVRVGVAPLDHAASGRRVTTVRRPDECGNSGRPVALTGAGDRERQRTSTREVVSP